MGVSALCAALSAAGLYTATLEPLHATIAAAVSAFIGLGGLISARKFKEIERERRSKLAKALAHWQDEARQNKERADQQGKLRGIISTELVREKEIAQNYLDVANIFMAAIGPDGTVEVINRKGLEILGCAEQDILGEDFAKFCVPEMYREMVATELRSALSGQRQILARAEYPITTARGERLINWSNAVVKDNTGRAKGLLFCGEDVTDRRAVEARLQLMRMMLESVDEGVIAIDARGLVVWANPACEKITEFAARSVQGKPMGMMYPTGNGLESLSQAMIQMMENGSWKGEVHSRKKTGVAYPQRLSLSAIKDASGRVTHAVAVFSDITKEKEQEERVRYLASHDTLTGLPNRGSFNTTLDESIARASKKEKKLAILFIDLDHFKKVNDTLGHEAGDKLLIEVATRMRATLRANDFISRLGGDEFTAIIEDLTTAKDAENSALKVLEALSKEYEAVGTNKDIRVTPSIGICIYPDDGKDAATLLKKSDQAMYAVKSAGRGNLKFFSPEIHAKEDASTNLGVMFKKAMSAELIEMRYQPRIDYATGALDGFEALARWSDSERGDIPPEEFIPAAEEAGLAIEFGYWALREVCRMLGNWNEAGLNRTRIGVNFSARQLKDKALVGQIRDNIQEFAIDPEQLEIEVTEAALMKDEVAASATLAQIKALGCRITLDDFGTGYSSLSRLIKLSIDCVKIDRSFMREASAPESANGSICRAAVAMGQSLGIQVIAEGVETKAQESFLKSIGANGAQGFLYAKALKEEQAMIWLARRSK